ncbi:hypothetical protein ACS0TY_030112 [Phlomoides rotata]
MAHSNLIFAFFLLAILIAQSTHGRMLKVKNKNHFHTQILSTDCSSLIACGNEAAFTPPPPPPPPSPPVGHADDFRPTAPGHSPGIGHFP